MVKKLSDYPAFIREFMEAVYPNGVELAFACFTEETALKDATKVIVDLTASVAELEALLRESAYYLGNGDDDDTRDLADRIKAALAGKEE